MVALSIYSVRTTNKTAADAFDYNILPRYNYVDMPATTRKNYVIALRAVHTRLATLASQTRTKGILEGDISDCTADFSLALEALERVLTRLNRPKIET